MTPEQIKTLAKQAGGMASSFDAKVGHHAMTFNADGLIEFVRLVREVPAGMQLVPTEPTEAILDAGCLAGITYFSDAENIYKAMLETAKEQS